jgi:hypothetical protein
MKITVNRWVSFYYFVLAAIPIGSLFMLVQAVGPGNLWPAPYAFMNPAVLLSLGFSALTLAAVSFPNRQHSARFYLYLLFASLLLVAIWAFVLPGLVVLLYAIPSWFLWTLYRESKVVRHAA